MSVVEEQNSSEESPVQIRKTDRMLTKILQKLHRLGPAEDQKVSKNVTSADENGATLSGSSDNEKVV